MKHPQKCLRSTVGGHGRPTTQKQIVGRPLPPTVLLGSFCVCFMLSKPPKRKSRTFTAETDQDFGGEVVCNPCASSRSVKDYAKINACTEVNRSAIAFDIGHSRLHACIVFTGKH